METFRPANSFRGIRPFRTSLSALHKETSNSVDLGIKTEIIIVSIGKLNYIMQVKGARDLVGWAREHPLLPSPALQLA